MRLKKSDTKVTEKQAHSVMLLRHAFELLHDR